MSVEKARNFLTVKGYGNQIIITEKSTATVELAAQALGAQPEQIAKSLTFLVNDSPILIVAEGTGRIDNHKFKETFHTKASMIPWDSVEAYIGHAPGGVCPFGINQNVKVYLDETLKKHDYVYPAAGDENSCIKLSVNQLEEIIENFEWVDVCKDAEA